MVAVPIFQYLTEEIFSARDRKDIKARRINSKRGQER
jgi:hypothetical protein